MRRHLESFGQILLAGALIFGMGAVACAQDAPVVSDMPADPSAQQPQPGAPAPGQGQADSAAGRVSFLHGEVSTQHSNSSDWAAATLNTPVVNGDHISTGKNSRAEIQLDHANVLRMADESEVNVANLARGQMQLQVSQGLVNFDVLKNDDSNAEIDTPNVAIRPEMGEGSYRIQVNPSGQTIVDVRKGSAEISTPQGSTHVGRDQRITIEGNADNAQYQMAGAPGRDDWDKWNADRDHSIEGADSWRHTNPNYTGSQDLDAYGQWNDVPDYGDVWFPAVDPGWAPYRAGRWVYEPYYGWTWVSYEPWGWAPYHYGRWFVYGGNWGWWPGPVYAGYDPIWAPAYVSFFGFGGGGWGASFGFGFGFGNVGWLPCGPGDRFYPWYGRGIDRVNEVNFYNIHNQRGGFEPLRGGPRAYSNLGRAMTDERVRSGISSMQGNQFGRGAVPARQQRFDAGALRNASVMTGRNPISPSSQSYRSTDRQVSSTSLPSRANSNQRFFSTNSRQAMSGQAQNSFNRGGASNGRPTQQNSARPGYQSFGAANANRGNGSGMTQPGAQNQQRGFNAPAGGPQQQSTRPGWRTFTPPSGQSRQPQAQNNMRSYSGSGNYGSSRPSLNMQQPVVRPRGGTYSAAPSTRGYQNNGGYGNWPSNGGSRGGSYSPAPSGRSYPGGAYGGSRGGSYSPAPSGRSYPGGNYGGSRGGSYSPAPSMRSAPSGGGYRGGYSGGSPRGGYSGGGRGGYSGGGFSSRGGQSSSGRGRR